jgi:hypothetical protein
LISGFGQEVSPLDLGSVIYQPLTYSGVRIYSKWSLSGEVESRISIEKVYRYIESNHGERSKSMLCCYFIFYFMLVKNLILLQKDIIDITLFDKASREYQFYKHRENFTIRQNDELKCPACACDCCGDPTHVVEKPAFTEEGTVLHKKKRQSSTEILWSHEWPRQVMGT